MFGSNMSAGVGGREEGKESNVRGRRMREEREGEERETNDNGD